MEYHVGIKKSEVLIHTTTRMTLENMVSERSQAQKATYDMIYMKCRELADPQTESGCQGQREAGVTANRCGASFGDNENVLDLDSGDGFTTS